MSSFFFQRGDVFSGLGLLVGVAALVVVAGAVKADAQLAAEAPHGRPAGADALGFEQVVGQLLVSPVGAVEPMLGRPVDDPAAHLVGQGSGEFAGLAFGLLGSQGLEAGVAVGIEPAGHGLSVHAQVGGDVLAWAAAVGHKDDLEAVPELGVRRGAEEGIEALDLGWR